MTIDRWKEAAWLVAVMTRVVVGTGALVLLTINAYHHAPLPPAMAALLATLAIINLPHLGDM